MKIVDFQSLVLGTPWRNISYLVIELEDGTTGIGESRILGKTQTLHTYFQDIKRHIIGHDVHDIEALYERITLLDFGVAHELEMTALAMIEMAHWDCIGKLAKQPVYKLLGGKVRDKVPAYANGWYKGPRTPELFHEAAKKVVKAGYTGLKFDPFGAGNLELSRKEYKLSLDIIEAVADAIGDNAQMHIEMHGRFAPHQAVEIAKDIEHYKPAWIEEPCRPEDLPALKQVAQHTTIPIATGERLYSANQFRELFELRCVNVVQLDLTQCGGILESKKICSTAETYSVMAAPHNVGGIVSTLASLHLILTLRNGKILEHFNDFTDQFVKKAGHPYPEVVDGHFSVPEGPGWGIELDMDFIRAHPPAIENGIILDPGLNMFKKANWAQRDGK